MPQRVVSAAEMPEETIQRAAERLCGGKMGIREGGKEGVDSRGTPGKVWEAGSHLCHHPQGLGSHPAFQGVPRGSPQPEQQVIGGGGRVCPGSLLAILGSVPR